jgi:ADP-ribosyl-[dinitrogen reductase] hydrolase
VALFYGPNIDEVVQFSAQSSSTTHGAPEAVECCQLLGSVLAQCSADMPKHEVLDGSGLALTEPKVLELAAGHYLNKSRSEVRGSGYAVASLEAALWCFHTTSTFEAAVLEAANLGEDADTTAAIVGQVAGAFYGAQGIPAGWLAKLHMREEIMGMAEGLYERAVAR